MEFPSPCPKLFQKLCVVPSRRYFSLRAADSARFSVRQPESGDGGDFSHSAGGVVGTDSVDDHPYVTGRHGISGNFAGLRHRREQRNPDLRPCSPVGWEPSKSCQRSVCCPSAPAAHPDDECWPMFSTFCPSPSASGAEPTCCSPWPSQSWVD